MNGSITHDCYLVAWKADFRADPSPMTEGYRPTVLIIVIPVPRCVRAGSRERQHTACSYRRPRGVLQAHGARPRKIVSNLPPHVKRRRYANDIRYQCHRVRLREWSCMQPLDRSAISGRSTGVLRRDHSLSALVAPCEGRGSRNDVRTQRHPLGAAVLSSHISFK